MSKITHKMLTEQLHNPEADGLINREVYPEIPPRVEYSITEMGMETIPVIEALRQFGSHYKAVGEQPKT